MIIKFQIFLKEFTVLINNHDEIWVNISLLVIFSDWIIRVESYNFILILILNEKDIKIFQSFFHVFDEIPMFVNDFDISSLSNFYTVFHIRCLINLLAFKFHLLSPFFVSVSFLYICSCIEKFSFLMVLFCISLKILNIPLTFINFST
jgi:hypothetical protein